MNNSLKEAVVGARDALPILFGFVPVGITYAIVARQAGLSALQTQLMSLSVFAGASQIMASGMLMEGAGIAAIIFATLMLNMRHMIMSTCVMDKLEGETPFGLRAVMSFFVTDETFALFTTTPRGRCSAARFFGLAAVTYLSWQLGTALGCVTSDILPDFISAPFGIALYALFIGLTVPGVRELPRLIPVCLLTMFVNFILSGLIPQSYAIIISTLAGATAGMFLVPDALPEHPEERGEPG